MPVDVWWFERREKRARVPQVRSGLLPKHRCTAGIAPRNLLIRCVVTLDGQDSALHNHCSSTRSMPGVGLANHLTFGRALSPTS